MFIKLNLHDLPPGVHAFHFHRKAQCDPPDFKSAGPHFNPDGKEARPGESRRPPRRRHEQLHRERQGPAKFKVVNKDVTLGDDSHSLFSNGGTALVIHAKADDMKTDPAGNAGDRIACGVITK